MAIEPRELNTAPVRAQGVSIDPIDDTSMVINMGPQHPSTHGVLRVVLELDGETIVSAVPHMGYVHTGIEKEGEYRQYLRVVLMEIQRIASHLVWLATHALDIGAMTIFFYTFRDREQLLDITEM